MKSKFIDIDNGMKYFEDRIKNCYFKFYRNAYGQCAIRLTLPQVTCINNVMGNFKDFVLEDVYMDKDGFARLRALIKKNAQGMSEDWVNNILRIIKGFNESFDFAIVRNKFDEGLSKEECLKVCLDELERNSAYNIDKIFEKAQCSDVRELSGSALSAYEFWHNRASNKRDRYIQLVERCYKN